MRVREAREDDIPRVVELGVCFLRSGPYAKEIGDDPEYAAGFARNLLKRHDARILVAEVEAGGIVGVFAFLIYPHYFSGDLTAIEIIWYVEPGYRGQASLELLWAAEKLAHELGALRMQLTAPDEHAGAIYERCHYRKVEVCYQTELESRVNPHAGN